MKKFLFSVLLLGLLLPTTAKAEPKAFLDLWWWSSHWKNQDFKPYYQDGNLPHNTQWAGRNWQPKDWIEMDGGDVNALMQKFYNAGFIKEQYVKHDVPYLEVGTNFYHLSGYDKGRVMATVDAIYKVTDNQPRMFYLKDGVTEKVIGYYTPFAGLVLE